MTYFEKYYLIQNVAILSSKHHFLFVFFSNPQFIVGTDKIKLNRLCGIS